MPALRFLLAASLSTAGVLSIPPACSIHKCSGFDRSHSSHPELLLALSALTAASAAGGLALEVGVDRHRGEEQRQVGEREEVRAQRPAALGAAQQSQRAVDEA